MIRLSHVLTDTSDGSNFGSNWQKSSSNGLRVTLARTLRRPLKSIEMKIIDLSVNEWVNIPMRHAHNDCIDTFASSCINDHFHCWNKNFASFETETFFWAPFFLQIIFESKWKEYRFKNLQLNIFFQFTSMLE